MSIVLRQQQANECILQLQNSISMHTLPFCLTTTLVGVHHDLGFGAWLTIVSSLQYHVFILHACIASACVSCDYNRLFMSRLQHGEDLSLLAEDWCRCKTNDMQLAAAASSACALISFDPHEHAGLCRGCRAVECVQKGSHQPLYAGRQPQPAGQPNASHPKVSASQQLRQKQYTAMVSRACESSRITDNQMAQQLLHSMSYSHCLMHAGRVNVCAPQSAHYCSPEKILKPLDLPGVSAEPFCKVANEAFM